MLKYQPLSTEKYWLAAAEQEAIQVRDFQRRQAREQFKTIAGGLFSIGFAFFATITSHQWIPATLDFLRESNVISM